MRLLERKQRFVVLSFLGNDKRGAELPDVATHLDGLAEEGLETEVG